VDISESEPLFPEFIRFEFSDLQIEALKQEMHNLRDFEGSGQWADGKLKFRDETNKSLHHLFAEGACIIIDLIAEDMRAAMHLRPDGPVLLVTLLGEEDLWDATVALDFRKMIERSLADDVLELHDDAEELCMVDHLRELAKMFSDAADRLAEQLSA
jgi:hypothetical protein